MTVCTAKDGKLLAGSICLHQGFKYLINLNSNFNILIFNSTCLHQGFKYLINKKIEILCLMFSLIYLDISAIHDLSSVGILAGSDGNGENEHLNRINNLVGCLKKVVLVLVPVIWQWWYCFWSDLNSLQGWLDKYWHFVFMSPPPFHSFPAQKWKISHFCLNFQMWWIFLNKNNHKKLEKLKIYSEQKRSNTELILSRFHCCNWQNR